MDREEFIADVRWAIDNKGFEYWLTDYYTDKIEAGMREIGDGDLADLLNETRSKVVEAYKLLARKGYWDV
jgi:hypothetical protein